MKQLFPTIIICFLSAQIFYGQDEVLVNKQALEDRQIELNWMPTYEKALYKSKKERKPLLIYFTGSDWCGWCIKLQKEVFNTAKFKNWSEDIILLELDFPRRTAQSDTLKAQNAQLKNMFQVRGYPSVYFINPEEAAEGKINLNNLGKTGYINGGAQKWIKNANSILETAI